MSVHRNIIDIHMSVHRNIIDIHMSVHRNIIDIHMSVHRNIIDIHISVHRNIITNCSQQDATFLEFIYFYRRRTCFRRFLCLSSGAHNCMYSFRYCEPILLLAATVEEMEFHLLHGSS